MGQVSIIVAGRSYRMSCDDGEEEHLEELGKRYDAAIDELRAVFGEIGDQRLMVMAAVLMTDRLDEAEKRIQSLEEEFDRLRGSSKSAVAQYENQYARLARVLDAAAQRVESLAERLDGEPGEPVSEN
jgi:cell division protein ZapA